MSIRSAARRLFSREQKLGESVVSHSKLDEAVLRDWRKRAPVLEDEIARPPEVSRTYIDNDPEPGTEHTSSGPLNPRVWEKMVEDTFYAYFGKDEPQIAARDAVAPEFRVNRAVADKHTRDDRFTEQRAKTRMRGLEASLGAVAALDSVRESYEGELREDVQRASEVANREDVLDKLDEAMAELREQRAEADSSDLEELDAEMRKLGKAKRQVAADLKQAQGEIAGRSVEIAKGAAAAAAKAAAAADEAIERASKMMGLGVGKEAGQGARISPEAAFALAERYARSPVLMAVAEMLGRLEMSMGGERRKMRKGGAEEMVDIELGNDLQFVLPQEKMLLMHPLGRQDFYRRYAERSLTQYEMWSELEEKRGSVIVLLDGSQSMEGAKNVYARATALAIVGMANREKRDAVVIEFSGVGQAVSFRFPKGQPLDPVLCADLAEHAFNGGTSTLTGMRVAREIMQTDAPFYSADLVIATDGEDRITDEDIEIRDEFREMGVRIHGMSIGLAPTRYLLDICDRTTPVYEYHGHAEANHRLAVDIT